MKVNAVTPRFTLSEKTLQNISKKTKLSTVELTTLSPEKARELMVKRGVIKKKNPIVEFISDMYQRLGERLGLLQSKNYHPYIYIDID